MEDLWINECLLYVQRCSRKSKKGEKEKEMITTISFQKMPHDDYVGGSYVRVVFFPSGDVLGADLQRGGFYVFTDSRGELERLRGEALVERSVEFSDEHELWALNTLIAVLAYDRYCHGDEFSQLFSPESDWGNELVDAILRCAGLFEEMQIVLGKIQETMAVVGARESA